MIEDMKEPRHARLTAARALIGDNPVLLGIAGLGFSVSFQTIASLARAQHMPGYPVLYPILIDLGILGFIVEARKAIGDGRSDLVPRLLAWALAGFTIYVNAHGSPARDWLGVALHVVAPALWVAFLEMSRWRTRRRVTVLREGTFPRWVLAPLPTYLLYRKMVLWNETSYARALEREQLRRRTMARLRAAHGSRWRRLADQSAVWTWCTASTWRAQRRRYSGRRNWRRRRNSASPPQTGTPPGHPSGRPLGVPPNVPPAIPARTPTT